jgi:hypothetical protein
MQSADAGIRLSLDGGIPRSVDGGAPAGPVLADCVPSSFTLPARPAEAVLVQDRSSAMAESLATDTTKWAASVSALASATASSAALWGLMLFPKPSALGECCAMPTDDLAPEVEVAPRAQAAAEIGMALALANPAGIGRPLARAIVQGGNYLSTRTTTTSKYLVLVVAGEPTCSGDGVCSAANVTDYARTKDAVTHVSSLLRIPVAVAAVGLTASANSMQPAQAQLLFTELAKLGGMPNTTPGQPSYYPAASAAELEGALASIAAQMRSCSFALAGQAAATSEAQVTVGDVRVPRDTGHENGWDFGDGGSSVVLYGKPCTDLRSAPSPSSIQLATLCPQAVL